MANDEITDCLVTAIVLAVTPSGNGRKCQLRERLLAKVKAKQSAVQP